MGKVYSIKVITDTLLVNTYTWSFFLPCLFLKPNRSLKFAITDKCLAFLSFCYVLCF